MSAFPFTRDGRQTLIYLVLAGCGPALTAVVVWAMKVIRDWSEVSAAVRLDKFAQLAFVVAIALVIIVVALSCFVSIRAIKLKAGKDGIDGEMSGEGGGE